MSESPTKIAGSADGDQADPFDDCPASVSEEGIKEEDIDELLTDTDDEGNEQPIVLD